MHLWMTVTASSCLASLKEKWFLQCFKMILYFDIALTTGFSFFQIMMNENIWYFKSYIRSYVIEVISESFYNFAITGNHSVLFNKRYFLKLLDLSEKIVFTFFQNLFCLRCFLHAALNNTVSLFFLVKWHMHIFVYYKRFCHKDLLSRNLHLNFHLIIMTCWSSLLLKVVWFASVNSGFIGTTESNPNLGGREVILLLLLVFP